MTHYIDAYFRNEWNKTHLQRLSLALPKSQPYIDTINIFSQSAKSMQLISYEHIASIISHEMYCIKANTTLEIIMSDNEDEWNYEMGTFVKTNKPFITIINRMHVIAHYGTCKYYVNYSTKYAIKHGFCDECKNYAETQTMQINLIVICEQLNDFDNFDADKPWTNVERVFADIFLVSMIGKM